MARGPFSFRVLDATTGLPVSGASVLIEDRDTGTDSDVFDSETGGGAITNPLSTSAIGRVAGWLEEGAYRAVVSKAGVLDYTQNFDVMSAQNGAITSNRLASNSFGASEIAADAVGTTKIAADAVSARVIQSDSVTAAEITADAVTTAKIVDGAVTNAKLVPGIGGTGFFGIPRSFHPCQGLNAVSHADLLTQTSQAKNVCSDAAQYQEGGAATWDNPGGVQSLGGGVAGAYLSGNNSWFLRGGSWSFGIPSGATVLGIHVVVRAYSDQVGSGKNFVVQLRRNQVVQGSGKQVNFGPSVDYNDYSFGGSSDMWGGSWTPDQINSNGANGFAIYLQAGYNAGSGSVFVDGFTVTVYYSYMAEPVKTTYMRGVDSGTFSAVVFRVSSQAGNVAAGVYANTGSGRSARPGAQQRTSGSISCPAAGDASVSVGSAIAVTDAAYWFALGINNSGGVIFGADEGNPSESITMMNGTAHKQDTFPPPGSASGLAGTTKTYAMVGMT